MSYCHPNSDQIIKEALSYAEEYVNVPQYTGSHLIIKQALGVVQKELSSPPTSLENLKNRIAMAEYFRLDNYTRANSELIQEAQRLFGLEYKVLQGRCLNARTVKCCAHITEALGYGIDVCFE
jgi:hypothetical protein